MKRISLLDRQLANQIAAGEVVERPSSVVKELLENSLDAGADRIEVNIQGGGRRLIRVSDNGTGIHKDDLLLAVCPHATSKISAVKDLNQLATMGFRGEALASISSVSRFRLWSRQHSSAQGWCLNQIDSDGQFAVEPFSCAAGTSIEVKELFCNTPARRRFLRTDKTEFAHIEETIRRFVMSAFHVSLALYHNGKLVRRFQAVQSDALAQQRLREVFGKGFLPFSHHFSQRFNNHHLSGWLADPSYHRSSSDGQLFFINQRVVRDRVLTHAVKEAYGTLLAPGRFPCYAIYLDMPAENIDVNVHPTKHEVRFKQPRDIHDMIVHSLQSKLHSLDGVSEDKVPATTLFDDKHNAIQQVHSNSEPKQTTQKHSTVQRAHTFEGDLVSLASKPDKSKSFERIDSASLLSPDQPTTVVREPTSKSLLETVEPLSHLPSSSLTGAKPLQLIKLCPPYFWCELNHAAKIIDGQRALFDFFNRHWVMATDTPMTALLEPLVLTCRQEGKLDNRVVAAWQSWGLKLSVHTDRVVLLAAPRLFKCWSLPYRLLLSLAMTANWRIDSQLLLNFCQQAIHKELLNKPELMINTLQEVLAQTCIDKPQDWCRTVTAESLSLWFDNV